MSDINTARQIKPALVVPTLAATIGAALLLPLGMIQIGAADQVRMLFPAYALIVAVWLENHQRPVLPSFVVALFAFSPFLRRIADSHAGFDTFSPILLGPYFALLPTLPAFMRRTLGQAPGPVSSFLVLAVCIAYAACLAILDGRYLTTTNELIRWVLPMSLCVFIMEKPDQAQAIKRSLIVALACVLPILSIYGMVQYVNPQLWDVLWMANTRNAAIAGLPYPYQVRVFSMMNSAMSLAVFVASGLVLVAGEGGLGLIVAAATLPVLALTMDRQAWLQCGIAAALLIISAPPGRKLLLGLGIGIVILGTVGLMTGGVLPPTVQNELNHRFSTFSSLASDPSADERLRTYDSFFDRIATSPFGEGFGVNMSTAADAEHRNLVALDSAVLEVALTFGVVAGTFFMIAIIALTVMAVRTRTWHPNKLAGGTALILSVLATSPLGNNLIGESGILLWTAMGILLAASPVPASRTHFTRNRNAPRPPRRVDEPRSQPVPAMAPVPATVSQMRHQGR